MPRKNQKKNTADSEQAIQDWLQDHILKGKLRDTIEGVGKILGVLEQSSSPTWWPQFPVDYLSRLRIAEAADTVLRGLYSLEEASTSRKSISRTKNEALFTDLLYCNSEASVFVVIEIKKDKATARETLTELLAYEHEILNHIPFGGRDILMVVVSREYSPLLDHALAGLMCTLNLLD